MLKSLVRFHIYVVLGSLTVTNGYAEFLVATVFPMLTLTGFATVVNNLATGACLQLQATTLIEANTAVCTLSLVD